MTTWAPASAAWTSAALAVVVGLAASSASAAPQYASDRYEGGYGAPTVRCDSNDNRYRRCPADTRRGVQLVRQHSNSQCIEGRTWGYDRDAVWVSSGCRAEFAMGRGGWSDGGHHGGNYGGGRNGGNYGGGNYGNRSEERRTGT